MNTPTVDRDRIAVEQDTGEAHVDGGAEVHAGLAPGARTADAEPVRGRLP